MTLSGETPDESVEDYLRRTLRYEFRMHMATWEHRAFAYHLEGPSEALAALGKDGDLDAAGQAVFDLWVQRDLEAHRPGRNLTGIIDTPGLVDPLDEALWGDGQGGVVPPEDRPEPPSPSDEQMEAAGYKRADLPSLAADVWTHPAIPEGTFIIGGRNLLPSLVAEQPQTTVEREYVKINPDERLPITVKRHEFCDLCDVYPDPPSHTYGGEHECWCLVRAAGLWFGPFRSVRIMASWITDHMTPALPPEPERPWGMQPRATHEVRLTAPGDVVVHDPFDNQGWRLIHEATCDLYEAMPEACWGQHPGGHMPVNVNPTLPESRCGLAGDPKHGPHQMTLTGQWPSGGPHAWCVGWRP